MRILTRVLTSLALATGLRAQGAMFFGSNVANVSYTGPGDVITTNVKGWWGLRAYSSATRGNAAINVCNVSDVACADMYTSASTGKLVITLIGGSDCSMVVCTVKKIYDQTAGGLCGGSCDLVQATIGSRPVLTLSCIGALPCLTWASTKSITTAAGYASAVNQPFTVSGIAERTGAFTTLVDVFVTGGGTVEFGFGTSTNTAALYAGAEVNATAADGAFHAIQGLFNGASSALYVDGSNTGSLNTGTGNIGTSLPCMGNCPNGFTGLTTEIGLWAGDKSANFSALNTNQHSFWGF